MLSVENLASIESEGRRLALTARREPGRRVPQYSDWVLADLVKHLGTVHGRTTLIVEQLPTERISGPRAPEGADPIDWYEERLEEMLATLRDADPTAPCWGFWPDSCVGRWESRMVVETGLHRWDAYQAFGEEDRLTDHVACTGFDEFADLWLPFLGEVQPLEVTAWDLGRSWRVGGDEPTAFVEGAASDIFLRLMSRPSPVELPEDWATAVDGLTPPPKP
jgi:uncharacterized protein (TIGR03083 family)